VFLNLFPYAEPFGKKNVARTLMSIKNVLRNPYPEEARNIFFLSRKTVLICITNFTEPLEAARRTQVILQSKNMKLKRKQILRKILRQKLLANYCNFFTWKRYKALIRMCYEWIGLTKEYEECLMGEAKIFNVQQQINTLTNKSFLDCLSIPLCLCV